MTQNNQNQNNPGQKPGQQQQGGNPSQKPGQQQQQERPGQVASRAASTVAASRTANA